MSKPERYGDFLENILEKRSSSSEKELPSIQEILNNPEQKALKSGIFLILSRDGKYDIVEKLLKEEIISDPSELKDLFKAQKEAYEAKAKIDKFIQVAKSGKIINKALAYSEGEANKNNEAYQNLVNNEVLTEAVADPENLMRMYVEDYQGFDEIMKKTSEFDELQHKMRPLQALGEEIRSEYNIDKKDFDRLINIQDNNEAEREIKKYVKENVSFIPMPKFSLEKRKLSVRNRHRVEKKISIFRENGWQDFLEKSEEKLKKAGKELRESMFDDDFVEKLQEVAYKNNQEPLKEKRLFDPDKAGKILEDNASSLHEEFKNYIEYGDDGEGLNKWTDGLEGFNREWETQRNKQGGSNFVNNFLNNRYPELANDGSVFSKALMQIFERILLKVEKYS